MTNIFLGLIIIILGIIAYRLSQIRVEFGEQFKSFRSELKGYLVDMYAEIIKKE